METQRLAAMLAMTAASLYAGQSAATFQMRPSRDSACVRNVSFEALAATQPYARTVTVFLDRVKELNRNRGMPAHEITHVLEGIDRHSATGIMKARWDNHDNFEIGGVHKVSVTNRGQQSVAESRDSARTGRVLIGPGHWPNRIMR
jgi:hypothetical protein